MAKKKGAALRVRKKNWYKIIAPRSFRGQTIGETLLDSAEKLVNKTVTANLSSLIGDMKKQGIVIKFKVNLVKPEGAYTEIIGYRILPATLKRFARRSVKAITDSFECLTADNIRIRVKPMILTRGAAKGGVSKILSKTGKISLVKYIKSKRYSDLVNDIISTRLQREIKEKLNKIFPTRIFEIKALIKIEGEVKEDEEKPEAKPKKEEPKEEKPKPAEKKETKEEEPSEKPVEKPEPKKEEKPAEEKKE